MKTFSIIAALTLALVSSTLKSVAQEKAPEPPALTDVQKLRIQGAAQAVEIWQLRAQLAAMELEKARKVLNDLVASSTPEGYVINDQLLLVPKARP